MNNNDYFYLHADFALKQDAIDLQQNEAYCTHLPVQQSNHRIQLQQIKMSVTLLLPDLQEPKWISKFSLL